MSQRTSKIVKCVILLNFKFYEFIVCLYDVCPGGELVYCTKTRISEPVLLQKRKLPFD